MSKEINNNSKINMNNINNINKEEKNSNYDTKNKFSPGKLSDSVEIHKLFHSFSNNESDNKKNKNNDRQDNKNTNKNDSKKISHKANHSLQINNNSKNVNSKVKNLKSKYNNNNQKQIKKKIQIQKKVNKNKKIQEKKETDVEDNNNINDINNNVISISDNTPFKEMESNDLNIDLKGDESIELKFKEYKNETSKIINDLKLQVSFLKTTLGNFEESTKQKEKLNNHVKNKEFIQAFETSVEIGNIQDIYYVIKKFQLASEQEDIPANVLGDIMKILCEDILSCENLRLITMFILKNICDKKIMFDKDLNKEINNVFFDLYNKRKELCLMKSDITNILKIGNYFSKGG